MGRTIVFPAMQAHEVKGLRISPVGVVEEKEKLRVIHGLTFGGQTNAREGWGGEKDSVPEPGGRSVNSDTNWKKVPECRLAGVIMEVITRFQELRVKYGTQERILLQKMDVKSAFRQVGVAPDRTAAFAYRMEDLVFVDLRLQFGWRRSPGLGGDGEHNPGNPSVDDVGIGRDIGGSHRGDQPRGRGGGNKEGLGAIATGMPGSESARRRRERSRVGDILRG